MKVVRRLALAVLASGLITSPALASAEGKGGGDPLVEYAGVPMPIIVGGRLVNYVFIVLKLTPLPGADPTRIKEREPFVRDFLVRLAHKQPLNAPGDATRVDERRISSIVQAEAPRLIGPRLVRSVGIARQTPQRRSGLSVLPSPRPIVP